MRIGIASIVSLLISTMVLAEEECLSSETCDDHYSAEARIRYGNINDHDDNTKNANTLTGRLLLSLRTPQLGNFNAVFAAEHVNDFGIHTYNDGGTNGQFEYATEADPSGTEMDEAYLQYRGEKMQIRWGRQYINHGALPQRFIGTAAWRQNKQTFDAITINVNPNEKLSIEGAVLEKVYRVIGRDHPNRAAREPDLDGLALQATYEVPKFGRVTGYVYDLDYVDNPSLSRFTYGVEGSGPCFDDDANFGWEGTCTAAIAGQSVDHDPYDSDTLLYIYVSLGVDFSNFDKDNETGSVAFAISGLEGDGFNSFKTPLAALHGFAGWADKFLAHTPDTGLTDFQIVLEERFAGWDWKAVFHRYMTSHQFEPKHFGSELDFVASRTFGKYTWLFKFANYQGSDDYANAYGRDATKIWTQVSFNL